MCRSLLLLCLCFGWTAAGCAPKDATLPIQGKVTLDGVPLEAGDLLFIPADPQFGSEPGKITSGVYQAKVRPGQNKVQIRATRAVPGKFGPMGTEPLLEDIIPAKYNAATTLSIEVTKEKKDGYDFALDTK